MTKNKIQMVCWTATIFTMLVIALTGCSGGSSSSGGSSANPTPLINVLPESINFGLVTEGNVALPREVDIQNNGTADLNVSNITLSGIDMAHFSVDLSGGTEPCGPSGQIIIPGDSCNVMVGFDPVEFGEFNAELIILSNDPNTPEFILNLEGIYNEVSGIKVIINQLDACPRDQATVYVSVLDDAGFPVSGLLEDNFSLKENGDVSVLESVDFVENATAHQPLSVSLLMDYSNSILGTPGAVNDMVKAAKIFVQDMNAGDEAEVIKYAASVMVVTDEFTGNQDLLIAAIEFDPKFSGGTAIYDAIDIAVGNLKVRSNERKAIILITDGKERSSLSSLEAIISQAQTNGIPVFTIGLGNVDVEELQNIADNTGGAYYESTTSDNLIDIYKKLSELLLKNQYILTYNSGIAENISSTLEVTVNRDEITATSMPFTMVQCGP